MEITFLGTASNNPSPIRNVSCTCVRRDGELWLFDAGEATQIQLMKSSLKPGKITKIFITHLHGDHVFGLPGLLCTIGQNIVENKQIELYGPVGLRRFIRTNLELSRSLLTYKYVVHELVPLDFQYPDDIKKWQISKDDDSILHPTEILGNQINVDDSDGSWKLFENDEIIVKASWIAHRVPTFGFVLSKKPKPGRLMTEKLAELGIKPGPLYAKIKAGQNIKLDDGSILEASQFIGESKSGKKITILGDCYEVSESMISLAMNSDVLVHEATLEDDLREKAISNGHSTPSMAAHVANRTNSRCLILNHFSQRYRPIDLLDENLSENESKKIKTDDSCVNESEDASTDCVKKLIDQAQSAVFNDRTVIGAYDLFTYRVD